MALSLLTHARPGSGHRARRKARRRARAEGRKAGTTTTTTRRAQSQSQSQSESQSRADEERISFLQLCEAISLVCPQASRGLRRRGGGSREIHAVPHLLPPVSVACAGSSGRGAASGRSAGVRRVGVGAEWGAQRAAASSLSTPHRRVFGIITIFLVVLYICEGTWRRQGQDEVRAISRNGFSTSNIVGTADRLPTKLWPQKEGHSPDRPTAIGLHLTGSLYDAGALVTVSRSCQGGCPMAVLFSSLGPQTQPMVAAW